MNKLSVEELAGKITDSVNSFSFDQKGFNEAMSREHRTLQQSFTRMCLKWIEHVATDQYKTDGRNEDSQRVCREMLDAFEKKMEERYGQDILMAKPSGYCSHV